MKRWGTGSCGGILPLALVQYIQSARDIHALGGNPIYSHCTYSAVSHVNVRRTLLLKTVKSKL